jgi:ribulose-5-phosphate 4-epimerase/fuculose-1-phosphate aldolase
MSDTLIEKMIDAGRILDMEGHGDHIFGHVTVRLPGDAGRFYMKSTTCGFDEMTPDNIVTVDIEGNKVAGGPEVPGEVIIHSEILRARPEMNSVVHTHAEHAVAFSSLGRKLLPVGHEGSNFVLGLPVFAETTDLILTQALGGSVAKCLDEHQALLLRNHGLVTCGRSIEEAIFFALSLEKACRVQLLAEAAGGPRLVTDYEEAKIKRARNCTPRAFGAVFSYAARRACRWGR